MNENRERDYWRRAVQEVLEASGLTLEELADKMGVTPRQVANWRRGQRPTGIVAVRFFEYRKTLLVGIVLHCN